MHERQIIEALERIEARQDHLFNLVQVIFRHLRTSERIEMATQDTLDRLTADVRANTDAVAAAAAALTGFVALNAELTQKLQDALAGTDEEAIIAAANAIEANNVALQAAIPAVAAAVIEGTPAAT